MTELITKYEETKRQQGQAIAKYIASYLDDLEQTVLSVELEIEGEDQ